MNASTCGVLCQHPGCWATRRRQERGLARSLPPLEFDDDSSDDEIKLPTQSVCNLLEDYGESPEDRYPLSTGGRPSHTVEGPATAARFSPHSLHSSMKLGAPHNTTASFLSKPPRSTKRFVKRNPRLRLVEVQEVFDRDDLRAQWDETFVTKQYYVWMPNPGKRRRHQRQGYKECTGVSTAQTNPVLVKDLTECMIPSEIEQKREETVLFDEWPVLKKKQPRMKSPSKTPRVPQDARDASLDGPIDRDGINELLALPKETLMKVLEHTKKSDFTSPGRLQAIVQHVAQDDERARLALGARHSFQHKQLQAPDARVGRHQIVGPGRLHYYDQSSTKPVYQLDMNADEDHGIIDRLSSINTPVKKKKRRPLADERGGLDEEMRPESEADSVETFPRYAHPLPGIQEPMGHPAPAVPTQRVLHYRGKIPSISLGLPELPSGIKTTKAFNYKRQEVDFSLGPVITPPSSYRSSEGAAFSEHGTTLKVNVSSTMPGMPESQYRDEDLQAIHRVSPALSTNVPVPPAGTPATFAHGSPTKSAPAGHLQHQYSWDTTRVTINWSQSALPPSRGEARGDSAQIARLIITPQGEGEGLEREATAGEDRALDTINETAREAVPTDGVEEYKDPNQKMETSQRPELHLETSTLKRIGAGESPRQKSARSVESCPSPEQWPLISESSIENIQRPSVSEPALSARSDRRRPISRDSRKDLAARKAMDDSKMKTESPAPPPPSPEPKDHAGETRSRKDLRSRDSLTMAPLFEVAELDDEGSPVTSVREGKNHQGKHMGHPSRAVGHMHSKKIEITVPVEREDTAREEEDEKGDKGGEMISQMTVMHVIPKGRGRRERRVGELERVQETFLNVDIPAEDVSSLKAEHGSSHQEDISSNDTVVKSQTTSSEVSVSPRARPPVGEENTEKETERPVNEDVQAEGNAVKADGKQEDHVVSARGKSLDEVPNSHRDLLDISNESPELLCDSARFISHEQVSPVEGEDGEGEREDSHRFTLGGLEGLGDEEEGDGQRSLKTTGRKESLLGNLTRRLDKDSSTVHSDDGESACDDGNTEVSRDARETKPADEGPDAQPPGVFFFQGSSTSESSNEVTTGQGGAQVDTASAEDRKEEIAPPHPDISPEDDKVLDAEQVAESTETTQDAEAIENLQENQDSGSKENSQSALEEGATITEGSSNNESVSENQENLDIHIAAGEDQTTTTDQQAVSGEGQTTTTDQQAVSGEGQTTTTDQQAVSGEGQTTTTDQQIVSGEDQTTTTDQQAVSGEDQTTTTDQQTVSGEDQTTTTDQQIVSGEDQTTTTDQQAVSGEDQTTTTDQQAVSGEKNEITTDLGEDADAGDTKEKEPATEAAGEENSPAHEVDPDDRPTNNLDKEDPAEPEKQREGKEDPAESEEQREGKEDPAESEEQGEGKEVSQSESLNQANHEKEADVDGTTRVESPNQSAMGDQANSGEQTEAVLSKDPEDSAL